MSETQRDDEWFAERAGKFTASRFADLLAVSERTGKPLKARQDLIWQVVAERLSGKPKAPFASQATAWGEDVEPYAKTAYELETGESVTNSGFIVHPKYPFCGASPDGLIGDDGGIEIKSPKDPAVHLVRFLDGIPAEYVPQVHGCMWVTERKWWDFVSYDPRFSGSDYELLRLRVLRDDEYIAKLELAVLKAEQEVQDLLKQLNSAIRAA